MKSHSSCLQLAGACGALTCLLLSSGPVGAAPTLETAKMELYPTYHAVGVEVAYTGDDDGDLKAEMEYRVAGDNRWREGVEMFFDRSKGKIWASVFRFEPGQKLDVRVVLTDPDAPKARVLGAQTTLRIPRFESGGGATYHVSPLGNDENRGTQTRPFATFKRAVRALKAGDTLVVGRGTYRETLDLSGVRGTAERPIIVRGAARDVRALDAPTLGQESRAGRVYRPQMPLISGARTISAQSNAWTRVEGDLWSAAARDVHRGGRSEGYLSRNDLHLFHYPDVENLRKRTIETAPEDKRGYTVELSQTRALRGDEGDSLPAWAYEPDEGRIYLAVEPGSDPNRDRFDYATLGTGVRLENSKHIVVRDLELSHFGENAVDFVGDTDACALVNTLVHHNRVAVRMVSAQADDNALWNNQIYDSGVYRYTWRAWMTPLMTRDTSQGVLAETGRGTSIVGNLVRGVFNSIVPEATKRPDQLVLNRDMDIIDNVVGNNGDDGYELDGGGVNMRLLDNFSSNALEGLSAAPIERGPVYVVGNRAIARLYAFKMMNNIPSEGATFLYHNTYYTVGGRGIRMPGLAPNKTEMLPFANKVWKNNVIQTHGTLVVTGRPEAKLDYNCYWYVAPQPAPASTSAALSLFEIGKTPTTKEIEYPSLAAYQTATGHELNGLFADPLLRGDLITRDDLMRALVDETIIPFDGRLQANSPCEDRGTPIRGINAGFAGRAPDIGAFEANVRRRYGGAIVAK